ncbi:GtrA family protein [Curvibacter gracilis]|uniref:GtrA family protein n=1 Tax=Curvibacter gracilis TaxID=230310 RepID=UPI00048095C3|nr:GtrA family protein [Curvibacter gracilis]
MMQEQHPPGKADWLPLRALWQSQRLRFVVIGLGNTLAGYLLFWGFYSLLVPTLPYTVVAVMTHVAAVTVSFVCQRVLVFRSQSRWWLEYLRFHLAHLGLFLMALGFLTLLVEKVGWHPLLAQAVVSAAIAASSYVVHTGFTFRQRRL